VVAIFIPEEWLPFTNYNDDGEYFDLHDYIKAYAVSKGVATQLIQERTLAQTSINCQIHWWLSLSFYVKALRTPYVLSDLDKSTAFAGIGYSLKNVGGNKQLLLGCSQIFNSQGEGLQYKLSKVENFTIQRDNAFLSYDDALRFGTSIRQMFFSSLGKAPERVVIHKRTYFSDDEKSGIINGLGEIKTIDLVEINIENNLRYVASAINKDGVATADGYPVRRGTCIQTGARTALLWNHGTSASIKNPNFKYFKGGRRIPAPLHIKKHYGVTNVDVIANEILGLSKMNWNTFDLYSQLPATLNASNEIARIGTMLSRYTDKVYDYRYFI
jgi:hypothetical protein